MPPHVLQTRLSETSDPRTAVLLRFRKATEGRTASAPWRASAVTRECVPSTPGIVAHRRRPIWQRPRFWQRSCYGLVSVRKNPGRVDGGGLVFGHKWLLQARGQRASRPKAVRFTSDGGSPFTERQVLDVRRTHCRYDHQLNRPILRLDPLRRRKDVQSSMKDATSGGGALVRHPFHSPAHGATQ